MLDLLLEADDNADTGDGETEYWGTDENGDEWRVHDHELDNNQEETTT